MIHQSDRGPQHISICDCERVAQAYGKGVSCDYAQVETINGRYVIEVMHRRVPWNSMEVVEPATQKLGVWFNHTRPLFVIRNILPAEAAAKYYRKSEW